MVRVDDLDAAIQMMLYTDLTYSEAYNSAPSIELRSKVRASAQALPTSVSKLAARPVRRCTWRWRSRSRQTSSCCASISVGPRRRRSQTPPRTPSTCFFRMGENPPQLGSRLHQHSPPLLLQVRRRPHGFLSPRRHRTGRPQWRKLHRSLQLPDVPLYNGAPGAVSALHRAAVCAGRSRVLQTRELLFLLPLHIQSDMLHLEFMPPDFSPFFFYDLWSIYIFLRQNPQIRHWVLAVSVQSCNSISKREAVRAKPTQGLLTYGPIKVNMPEIPQPSKLLRLRGRSETCSAIQNVLRFIYFCLLFKVSCLGIWGWNWRHVGQKF